MPTALLRVPRLPLADFARADALVAMVCAGTDGAVDTAAVVRDAIVMASPSLTGAITRAHVEAPNSALRAKVLRYAIRMSTRATPFGAFAGVALTQWGDRTTAHIPVDAFCGDPVIDMDWLRARLTEIEAVPDVRRHLHVIFNDQVTRRAGRLLLPAAAPTARGVSIRDIPLTRFIHSHAQRFVPHATLLAAACEELALPVESVETVITSLHAVGFLQTDLRPPWTCADPLAYVLERLEGVPGDHEVIGVVRDAARRVRALSRGESRLTASDDSEPATVPTYDGSDDAAQTFTVTTVRIADAQISRSVAAEGRRAAELLLELSTYPHGLPHVAEFRGAFVTAYGERCVPVLEALDTHIGAGRKWRAAIDRMDHAADAGGFGLPQQSTLLDIAARALQSRTPSVELTPNLLAQLGATRIEVDAVPYSLDLCFSVAAHDAAAIDAGDFSIVVSHGAGISGGGRYMGRFSHALGQPLRDALTFRGRREAALTSDVLLAELTTAPTREGMSNLLVRSNAFPYEVALNATPAAVDAMTIRVADIGVCVRNGRFRLQSLATGAEVRICASQMVAPTHFSDLARFLTEAGQDGQPWLHMFHWGPAEQFPYLPRVTSGRAILRPAQWRLRPADLDTRTSSREVNDLSAVFTQWRAAHGLPRYIHLGGSTERLLLDLDRDTHIAQVLSLVQRPDNDPYGTVLQEVLPALDDAWLSGTAGSYASEVVLTLVRAAPPQIAAEQSRIHRPVTLSVVPESVRVFAPGSEWLYLKCYCPADVQHDLLTGALPELNAQLTAQHLALHWHYLRYRDPDDHLRIRFLVHPEARTGALFASATAWARATMARCLCTSFSIDVYDREIEAFGGVAGMAIAETIFGVDSASALELLDVMRGRSLSSHGAVLSAYCADDFLASFVTAAPDRLAMYETLVSPHEGSGLFRRQQCEMRALLRGEADFADLTGYAALLQRRRLQLAPIAAEFHRLCSAGTIDRDADGIIMQLLHLHMNRILGAGSPAERSLIGLLRRIYHGISVSGAQ